MKLTQLISSIYRTMKRKRPCSRRRLGLLLAVILSTLIFFMLTLNKRIHNLVKEVEMKLVSDLDVMSWTKEQEACSGHFTGYGHQYAMLKDVILKPNDLKFYLPCSNGKFPIKYWFEYGKEGTHLNQWAKDVDNYDEKMSSKVSTFNKSEFAVAVLRYEYANLYHTMTDWYNVFLLAKLLDLNINNIRIVLYDNHTRGHFDDTWITLFGDILLQHKLTEPLLFKNLAWNIIGYESPMNWHGLKSLPFMNDFHNFFIQKHNIDKPKDLNCDKVSIFFLWRRDYVAHPNNPTGLVSRKVKNEDELITFFRKRYPNADIKGIQLDKLSFGEQLEIITKTDILISMHGAGLSHILFLPSHAGVVELFTLSWTKYLGLVHFRAMARWRGLKYCAWQNLNPANEYADGYTYIPPMSLDQHVNYLHRQLCPGT